MRWNKPALKKWIWWSNPKASPQKIALVRTLQVHIFLLIILSLGFTSRFKSAPHTIRMKTHTIQRTVAAAPQKTVQKKPVAVAPKVVKKEAPKTVAKPKPAEVAKPKPIDRIKQLDESLKKLEKNLKNPPKNLVVEAQLPATTQPIESKTVTYETQLIQLLQTSIKLIDHDPVDVTITVQPNGIVDRILSIDSLSPLNSKMVEGALNRMVFPPFEGEQPMEFTLHLCTDSSPL